MVSPKSEPVEDSIPPSASSTRAQDELQLWERLVFSFEMDRDHSNLPHGHPRNTQRSRSHSSTAPMQSGGANRSDVQDAALLAQFAAAANSGMDLDHAYSLPPPQYPSLAPSPGFYGNFFHHESMAHHTQLPPLASMDFPWPHLSPPQQHGGGQYDPHQASSSSVAPNPSSSPTFVPSHYLPQQPHPQEMASSRSRSGTSADELTEAERTGMAEEKRRRNTAASARFRIKKKQKTINLERSVSDLSGRAEELEREVSDLRRENGWLKEIVMLKGTRFAAASLSHRLALSQAAALAVGGGHSFVEGSSNSGAPPSSGHRDGGEEEEEYSESSEDEQPKKKDKSKQK